MSSLLDIIEGDFWTIRIFFSINGHGIFGALGFVDAAADCTLLSCIIALPVFAAVKSSSLDRYLVSDFGASPA
jgi:hypothetical protein